MPFAGGGAVVAKPKFGDHPVITTQTLESTFDKSRGAPAVVRNAVGGAPSDEDRLATIRKYYPDAQPYGDGNFVFTDPETHRPTLYNPPGLDMGDVASITPELAEGFGGIAGGAGAVAAAPFTGGQSLWAVPLGVGLGASAGREVENIMAQKLIGRVDTRSLPKKMIDTGVTTGVNAAGMRAGALIGEGARRMLGPVTKRVFTRSTPSDLKYAYDRQGIQPLPGAVSGSRPVQIMEHALSYTPGGSGVMQDAAEKSVEQTGKAAYLLSQSAGTRGTAQQTGAKLVEAAGEAGKRFAQRREVLDAQVEKYIGANTPVSVANIALLRGKIAAEKARAPKSLAANYDRALGEIDNIMADAKGSQGKLPFSALRNIRTRIGRELDRPDVAGYRPGEDSNMARLYGALADTIKSAAASSPDAAKALATHDRYVRVMRGNSLPVLDELMKQKTDEYAFAWAMQGVDKGGSRLWQLRRSLKPPKGDPNAPVWDELVSTVLTRMGQAKPGQQGMPAELLGPEDSFSPNTFLTNFSKLSPEAKSALFSGTRYKELRDNLDDLVRITASMKDAETMKNSSGTARGLLYSTLISSLGMAPFAPKAAATVFSGSVAAPFVVAKFLTNPKIVRWLASSRNLPSNPNAITKHFARLYLIGQQEPDIRNEVNQYLYSMRSYPGMQSFLGDRGPQQKVQTGQPALAGQ